MADNTKLYQVLSGLYNTENKIFNRLSGHEDDNLDHITSGESSYTSDDVGRVVRTDGELYLVKESTKDNSLSNKYYISVTATEDSGDNAKYAGNYIIENDIYGGSDAEYDVAWIREDGKYSISYNGGEHMWFIYSRNESKVVYEIAYTGAVAPSRIFGTSPIRDYSYNYTNNDENGLKAGGNYFLYHAKGSASPVTYSAEKIIDDSEFSTLKETVESLVNNM